MSGGGGGPWRPNPSSPQTPTTQDGGGVPNKGGGGASNKCDISEATYLNSVDRSVIVGLQAGDILDVVFQLGPPPVLAAVSSSGQIAGSITSQSMPLFIQCIGEGASYKAAVLQVRGAQCQVRIELQ